MARFLVDQQLPRALAHRLTSRGHEAKHIKDYSNGATLSDTEVTCIADSERRIVVTKDDDFRVTHILRREPSRLFHITCGNISTRELLALIDEHFETLELAINEYNYIEINRFGVIIHDRN